VIVSKPVEFSRLYNAEVLQVEPSEVPRDQRPPPPEVVHAASRSRIGMPGRVPHSEGEKSDLRRIVPALFGIVNPGVDHRQVTTSNLGRPPIGTGDHRTVPCTERVNSTNSNGGVQALRYEFPEL